MPNCADTFFKMFTAPLQSAFIRMPRAVLYCPRVMRLPDGFQLAGFSPPYVGKKSLSRNDAFEV